MKSLKRTLCLVLALVMVLGLFGVASAAKFTDDNTIQYKEAVDVMTGIGAISGYTDGTFNPKGTITRAEAAKLVTYAVLGKETADRLVGSTASSFSDVTVAGGYGWAIPSIEYLVREGVINGMGDGTFNPGGQITGIAVLKMLLCSIGYGAKGEYTGTGWDLQVVLDANKVGLNKGRTSTASVDAPATREEVALYCFNAIQCTKVEYIASLDIYNESTSIGGSKDSIAKAVYGLGVAAGNLKKDAPYTVNSSNVVTAVHTDVFGAPATTWTYKGVEIGDYAIPATLTYTTAKDPADLRAELKGYVVNTTTFASGITAVVNGKTAVSGDAGYQVAATASDNSALVTAVAALAGNGNVVKIYANEAKEVLAITVVKTELAKVTGVDATNKIVSLAAVKTAGGPVVQANYSIAGTGAAAQEELYAQASGLKKDDYVLVTPVKNDAGTFSVAAIATPTKVTGKITSVSTKGIVKVDGVGSYGTAASVTGNITANAKDDKDIWLDSFGFAIHVEGVNTDTKPAFAYILDTYQATAANGRVVDMAKVVYPNGTTETIPLATSIKSTWNSAKTAVYEFDDQYYEATGLRALKTATALAADGVGAEALKAYNSTTAIEATARSLGSNVATHNQSAPFATDVKFIYISATGDVTVKTGVQKVAETTTAMTAVAEKDANNTLVITAVYLPGELPVDADTSGVMFLASKTTLSGSVLVDGVARATYSYTAFVNGAPAGEVVSLDDQPVPGFYQSSAVTGLNGVVKLTSRTGETVGTTKFVAPMIVNANDSGYGLVLAASGDLANVSLAGATVVDLRSASAKQTTPIAATPEGIIAANRTQTNKLNLQVAAVVDTTTLTAKTVYILGAGTMKIGVTSANGNATVSPAVVLCNQGDAVTIDVTIGTTAGVKIKAAGTGATVAAKLDGTNDMADNTDVPTTLAANSTHKITFTVPANLTAVEVTVATT